MDLEKYKQLLKQKPDNRTDLSPLMQLVDNWYGSSLARAYKPPKDPEQTRRENARMRFMVDSELAKSEAEKQRQAQQQRQFDKNFELTQGNQKRMQAKDLWQKALQENAQKLQKSQFNERLTLDKSNLNKSAKKKSDNTDFLGLSENDYKTINRFYPLLADLAGKHAEVDGVSFDPEDTANLPYVAPIFVRIKNSLKGDYAKDLKEAVKFENDIINDRKKERAANESKEPAKKSSFFNFANLHNLLKDKGY